MSVVKLFTNCYSSYSFSLILTKFGTHDLCTNMKQTVEQIFEILILNVLANLFRPEASIEYSIFSFVELGCHYNYSQLSEETRLRRDLLCVECDIKRQSLSL